MTNPDSSIKKASGFSAIIQARMGATRLPGKVLMKLGDKPLIEHVISRILKCRPKLLVLAIPDGELDDPLAQWAIDNKITFVRGSLDNVLSRFEKAVNLCETDVIIRVTGDNPFVDPEVTVRTVRELQRESADFAVMENTPLGTTVEAFTQETFRKILHLAHTPDELEHVTLAVWNNPEKFKIHLIEASPHHICDGLRLTIDTERDFELAKLIYRSLAGDMRMIALRDIVQYVKHNPLVKRVNGDIEQHLGAWLKTRKSSLMSYR